MTKGQFDSIKEPNVPSNQETSQAVAEAVFLSPTQGRTHAYEKMVKLLEDQALELKKRYNELVLVHRKNDEERKRDAEIIKSYGVLKRGKLEMAVNFILATVAMFIGSSMITIYPKDGDYPERFWIGVILVGAGVVGGLSTRLLALSFYYAPSFFRWVFKRRDKE